MAVKNQKWPRSGFEQFFEYRSSFIHLNINLGSASACRIYHDHWMGRYRAAMASWDDFEVAAWSVRMRQSLKLCYSATYFALASEEARGIGSLAAAYFLAYYSSLHAMWSVLFLHPNQGHDAVADITHSKLKNVFHSAFAGGKGQILQVDANALVDDLRFLREYYSYRMPLNAPVPDEDPSRTAHIHLGGFVKQSLQVSNLHSHLIRKAAERCGVQGAQVPLGREADFSELFFRINGKAHPSRGLRALDPADLQARREFLEIGCDLVPHSVACDHMLDDFMTYADENRPSTAIVDRVRSLVFGAFF